MNYLRLTERVVCIEPGGENVSPSTVFVTSNQLASSVYGEDAGRKIAGAATRLGIAALAFDRPGSGRFTRQQRERFSLTALQDHAEETAQELRPLFGEFGFTHAIIAGNSAAGLYGAAVLNVLAKQQTATGAEPLKLTGCFMDPIGVRNVSIPYGVWAFGFHQLLGERNIFYPPRPDDDREELASGLSLGRTVRELWNYSLVGSTEVSRGLLFTLAEVHTDIAVRASFPQHTFNDSADRLRALAEGLNWARSRQAAFAPGVQPFHASLQPGYGHFSYEHFDTYSEEIRQAWQMTAPPAEAS